MYLTFSETCQFAKIPAQLVACDSTTSPFSFTRPNRLDNNFECFAGDLQLSSTAKRSKNLFRLWHKKLFTFFILLHSP